MERELVSISLYQKLKEILISYGRIILTASKGRLISKIRRVWLKNLNFEVKMAANWSILELMVFTFGSESMKYCYSKVSL